MCGWPRLLIGPERIPAALAPPSLFVGPDLPDRATFVPLTEPAGAELVAEPGFAVGLDLPGSGLADSLHPYSSMAVTSSAVGNRDRIVRERYPQPRTACARINDTAKIGSSLPCPHRQSSAEMMAVGFTYRAPFSSATPQLAEQGDQLDATADGHHTASARNVVEVGMLLQNIHAQAPCSMPTTFRLQLA